MQPMFETQSGIQEQPIKGPDEVVIYSKLADVERWLETYLLHKAPFTFPVEWRKRYVKGMPKVLAVFMVFLVPFAIFSLGLLGLFGTAFSSLTGDPFWAMRTLFYSSAEIAALGLTLAALPGLFARTQRGWTLFFYAHLLHAVGSALHVDLTGILSITLVLYLDFQNKYEYTGSA